LDEDEDDEEENEVSENNDEYRVYTNVEKI